jgi:dolichol-phosphate mannosyltransferase
MDGHPGRAWRLSLIIPAYNEELGIRQAVREADEALGTLADDYEILIVDDGSHDATAALVARECLQRPHVRLLSHKHNRGYGAALRTGFEAARFERVAFTDADCQFELADLAALVPLTDTYPLAVGYRADRQDIWRRRFISRGYNLIARAFFGTRVRDCDCALKVFRKDVLANLLPETNGFFVNTEMLTKARQLGYDVVEVPVRHRPRLRGSSKVSLGDVPKVLKVLFPFWWSRVLFAGAPNTTHHSPLTTHHSLLAPLLVFAAACLLFFTRLNCPLLEPDEARYAEIPRQMLAEGSWLVPILHGQPYYDKPPLLYWLTMGSYQLFGVHDWAARLVPGLAGLLTVMLTYLWGRRALGPGAALASAFILCLSAKFIYLGRMLTMDGLLGLCVIAALAAAHTALDRKTLGWGWWLLSAIATGLGLLTKGPVALALVAVPLFVYQWIDRRAARLPWQAWPVYLSIAVGLAAPWYAAVVCIDPGFADYFFWKHNVLRYVAPFDHAEPMWFYLPGLALGLLPWTLLLPPLVKLLSRRSARAAARRPAALGFFLLAFAWCLLFFSFSGSKRPGYILPAIPLLSLALGCYLATCSPRRQLLRAEEFFLGTGRRLAYRATMLAFGLGAVAALVASVSRLLTPSAGLFLVAAAAGGLAFLRVRQQSGRSVSWALCGCATFAMLLAGVYQLLPSYARRFSMRGQVKSLAAQLEPGHVPVVCYPRRWDSVSFYLQRDDVLVYSSAERDQLMNDLRHSAETLVFIKSERYLDDFLRELPGVLEFLPEGRQGSVAVGWVRPRREPPAHFLAEQPARPDRLLE